MLLYSKSQYKISMRYKMLIKLKLYGTWTTQIHMCVGIWLRLCRRQCEMKMWIFRLNFSNWIFTATFFCSFSVRNFFSYFRKSKKSDQTFNLLLFTQNTLNLLNFFLLKLLLFRWNLPFSSDFNGIKQTTSKLNHWIQNIT